ncbi:MAG: hypothetical protein HYY20_08890 [Candidatus Tectomicrobia bacterium]|uniref:Penicillin-binding protein activator LpoB n=1 Tax=Tectimicrobiota bacterium TaxID=2528274 RepID=A0A932CPB4_UNCTE|nr:hypothetical protein [Candidatus Tectomicrobia bacterium]
MAIKITPRPSVSSILILTLLFFLASCSGPTLYVHPSANFSLVKRVAVLPFDNLTDERTAGEIVHDIFVTQLLARGLFGVVEQGEVMRVIREKGLNPSKGLSATEAKTLGRALNIQGIILGTVEVYEPSKRGGNISYPVVAFSVRMVEVEKGEVIWKTGYSKDGLTLPYRLFGLNSKEIPTLTQEVANALLKTIE